MKLLITCVQRAGRPMTSVTSFSFPVQMFVRLFVDENLDRSVPISKQPKDKIQAILEACDRQFPEFHERARKRVRTYLKSCRRMRRSKDGNGWEQVSNDTPTPRNDTPTPRNDTPTPRLMISRILDRL